MIIYKIVNRVNGKVYVGKTEKTLQSRWRVHLRCAKTKVNRYVYDAINHYGTENFEIEQIDFATNRFELNQKEKDWIKYYNSMDKFFGYNMQEGGIGGTQPEEIRKRVGGIISIKNKGRVVTKETRNKISKANKGKKISEEQKRKLSELLKGRRPINAFTPEATAKRVATRKLNGNYKQSESTKLKISLARKGKPSLLGIEERQKRRELFLSTKNPMYKEADKEKLKTLVDSGIKTKEIAHALGLSYPTVLAKFKKYFGSSIEKYRGRLFKRKNFHHSEETKEKLRNYALLQFKDGMPETTKKKIKDTLSRERVTRAN